MENWQPMGSAPRDGTIIEVKNTYGVAPSYGLYRWSNEIDYGDEHKRIDDEYRWREVPESTISFTESHNFQWRPYHGAVEKYVDPTNGAQHTDIYWRAAAARSLGKPADYFEEKSTEHSEYDFPGVLIPVFAALIFGILAVVAISTFN